MPTINRAAEVMSLALLSVALFGACAPVSADDRLPDPIRTIAGRAADIDYYLLLPPNVCALDKADARDSLIFAEIAQEKSKAEAVAGGGNPAGPTQGREPTGYGIFAPCDQLAAFHTRGNREELRTLGVAQGSRKGKPDPSANAGIVYAARFMCGLMQRGGGQTDKEQVDRDKKLQEAWKKAEMGESSKLPAIETLLTGCISAIIGNSDQGARQVSPGVSYGFTTFALVPDWTITVLTRGMQLKSRDQFIQALESEKQIMQSIIEFGFGKS